MKESLRFISIDDYLVERQNVDSEYQALFDMAYLTGARTSELLSLEKRAIDRKFTEIAIHTLKNKRSPIRHTHFVPPIPELITSIQNHAWTHPEGKLFQYPQRLQPRMLIWQKSKQFFKCTTHSFRHTHATILVRDFGANIQELMQEMGWSRPDMALIYVNYAFSDSLANKVLAYQAAQSKGEL